MKKMNRKIMSRTNWLWAALLSLMGFSCDKIGFGQLEYGTPHADFIVSGKVTDSYGRGLEGIEVVVPRVVYHQRATSGFIPNFPVITTEVHDTLYTKGNGLFTYKHTGIPTNDSINVILKFDDIFKNPQFVADSTKVTFFASDLKGGHSWYKGSATKEVNIKLKNRE